MTKKLVISLLSVIVTVALFLVIWLLLKAGDSSEELAYDSNVFESVSALDALNMGLIDGSAFDEGNSDSSSAGSVPTESVVVSISLRSIQNDLKIKLSDANTGKLISGVELSVVISSGGQDNTMSDVDKDGIIYISGLAKGDYTVSLVPSTQDNTSYSAQQTSTITVNDAIQYTKVDVSDEIKTEAEVNVANEDTKVYDEDETSLSDDKSSSSSAATSAEESYDEDISQEAEDLLAQIEEENNAAGGDNGNNGGDTTPAVDVTTTPEYMAAHAGRKGIDVSKHNGSIDWNAVKNSGVEFVIIRCGYRGSSSGALIIDPMFETNINGARNAGLDVGVYFFSQAVNESEAVEEASMVLSLIDGYSLQCPVYMDVEKSNGRGDGISVDERTATIHAFLSTISGSGYSCGIYSNKKWFEGMISTSSLTGYNIWLAQYVDLPTYSATKYDMWQYSSKGQVPGINGNVDMNVIR
ncbi:glycoside hydrolase family 25 protein [Butyrivibrio proteoclasticus]|uniref:glycoside hydrolase family 25 protein n=1 Tax=Butyrivibrio proteoclasticus TaxID=43305 RepID=UPI000686E475|nr:glycoside hydrolase family 25 protein [Butyrivibrio proteoclasticus]